MFCCFNVVWVLWSSCGSIEFRVLRCIVRCWGVSLYCVVMLVYLKGVSLFGVKVLLIFMVNVVFM